MFVKICTSQCGVNVGIESSLTMSISSACDDVDGVAKGEGRGEW